MMAKQTVFGPYRVKNIGVNGDVYMVVCMIDNHSNAYEELRPNRTYLNRQSAYGKCLRLNRRWQNENWNDDYVLGYWKEATN